MSGMSGARDLHTGSDGLTHEARGNGRRERRGSRSRAVGRLEDVLGSRVRLVRLEGLDELAGE